MKNFNCLKSRRQQRGIVTAIAVILLFTAVIFVLSQTYGIIATNSNGNQSQGDSTAAVFLAESGLERAQSILKAAADPTLGSICTGIVGTNFTLGNGQFNLSATPRGCDGSNLNCTSCEITSTGLVVGSASRTLSLIMSLSAPSGGAKGCGGGGTTPPSAACAALSPSVPPANQSQYIDQNIAVTATNSPAILLSNVAYARHPQGNSNSVQTNTCVASIGPVANACITQWNDQSASNNGNNVIGSQGASVGPLTTLGTYTMRQSLTQDSLFAAVGMIVSGTNVDIVGSSVTNSSASYWDDLTSGNSRATVSGNGSGSGNTNDGSSCNFSSGSCNSATTNNSTTFGTKQNSNSWCYDGDTLVFGLSGSSNNSATGALTSFTFGTSPESTAVPNGTAIYPSTHTNNTQVFSSLRYLYNSYYRSTVPSGSPGATSYPSAIKGSIGSTFTGELITNTPTLKVTNLSGSLCYGDKITGSNILGGSGNSSTIVIDATLITAASGNGSCNSTSSGTYKLADNSSASVSLLSLSAASKQFIVTGTTGAIFTATATNNSGPIISSGPTTFGIGISGYTLTAQKTPVSATTYTQGSSSETINVPPGVTAPLAGTYVTIFSGTGVVPLLTKIIGTQTATKFTLSAAPTTAFPSDSTNTVICGGICAYFNHAAAATTNFTVGVSNTSQWAAGMTCLKGVDTSTIRGLTGTSASAKATTWHEVVN